MPLRLLEPGQPGERVREIPIPGEDFLIGRGTDCDLRLHDNSISRHHVQIRARGGDVTLHDLGSANGTYVNGTRVLSQTTLQTGDEVRVGPFRYIVDRGDDPDWAEKYLHSDVDPRAVTSRIPPQEPAKKLHVKE